MSTTTKTSQNGRGQNGSGQNGRGQNGRGQNGRGQNGSGSILNQRQTLLASASVPVSEKLIGAVVGRKGVTIIKIKDDTKTRISHLKPDPGNGHLFDSFHITGSPQGVDKARRWILSIIGNTYKTDNPDDFPVE
tara:strand:+ start:625 stop:1026 length:402 start_codon:yes stop_codon:yes gene_type:complete